MDAKLCPKCNHYSISYDYNRGVEVCRWRDCGWANVKHEDLPAAHKTIIRAHADYPIISCPAIQAQHAH